MYIRYTHESQNYTVRWQRSPCTLLNKKRLILTNQIYRVKDKRNHIILNLEWGVMGAKKSKLNADVLNELTTKTKCKVHVIFHGDTEKTELPRSRRSFLTRLERLRVLDKWTPALSWYVYRSLHSYLAKNLIDSLFQFRNRSCSTGIKVFWRIVRLENWAPTNLELFTDSFSPKAIQRSSPGLSLMIKNQ